MSILNKLLKKRGLKSTAELDSEERATFDSWQKILSKDQLTVEDIKLFCQAQISIIENKWKDFNLDKEKKAELIPYHTVYKNLEQVMSVPQTQREQLEAQLNQMLENA